MENEERKIIRRFPLPVMEVAENEIVYVDESNKISPFAAAYAVGNPGTASLNYTAADINTKLGMVNAYAAGTFTSDSYVSLVLLATSATGDSKFDGTYLITPYGNYNNAYDLSSAIVNFRVWVHNGIVHTCEVKCISGKIDTSKFEVIAATLKSGASRQALFIKSNGFRGAIFVREISVNRLFVTVYLNINDPENADIKSSWYIRSLKYNNVASELKGYTTPFEMKISHIPTSEDDLFQCLFGGEDQGPNDWMDLYAALESSILPQIVLTCNVGNYSFATITTNVDMEFDEDLVEYTFQLYFVYFGKYYKLGFKLGDDGVAVPGSASFDTLSFRDVSSFMTNRNDLTIASGFKFDDMVAKGISGLTLSDYQGLFGKGDVNSWRRFCDWLVDIERRSPVMFGAHITLTIGVSGSITVESLSLRVFRTGTTYAVQVTFVHNEMFYFLNFELNATAYSYLRTLLIAKRSLLS